MHCDRRVIPTKGLPLYLYEILACCVFPERVPCARLRWRTPGVDNVGEKRKMFSRARMHYLTPLSTNVTHRLSEFQAFRVSENNTHGPYPSFALALALTPTLPLPFSMLSLVPLHLPTFAVTFTLRGSAGHIVLLYVFLHVFLYNLCFPQQLYKLQCISGLGNTPDGKQQNFPNLSLFVPAVYLERNLTFTRILFALPVDLSK